MFSVLLSVYHKEKAEFLDEALNSIVCQTLKPDEIIIVEDGPLTNELNNVLDKFETENKCVKRVPLKVNSGLGKALNEGLKHCSNDLVARMDTDDIAFPDRFEKQVEFMDRHSEIDACSSWVDEFVMEKGNVTSVKKLPETHKEIIKYAKHRCPLNHPAVVYRKKAVLDVGGYTGFPEDYMLWVRMLMNGSKFHNLQESLLYFRFSPEVIKRRGGWKYAKDELKTQMQFYKMGFIGCTTLLYNISIRITVRLIPNFVREIIYKKGLREK